MKNVLGRIFSSDPNISRVLLYRLWTIIAGGVTIIVMPQFLTPAVQGYYYTFLSIAALQVLFDLGLSQVIAQVLSHEYAHVTDPADMAATRSLHSAKIAYIKLRAQLWYRIVAIMFFVGVTTSGYIYFSTYSQGLITGWIGPWVALILATGVNLMLAPRFAIVEASGKTGKVAEIRLIASLLGHALFIVLLALNAQLWSVVAVPGVLAIFALLWFRLSENPYRDVPPYRREDNERAAWRSELIGLQWRVAISWLGGYLVSQTMVPIVFASHGAIAAGQIGLGLQIFIAIQAVGMSWVAARIPRFGHLISRGDWRLLNRDFIGSAIRALTASFILSLAVLGFVAAGHVASWSLAARLPSVLVTALLAGVTVVSTAIYALAAYMRAHKEEPLVLSSLVIGSATFLTIVIASRWSADAVIIGYALVAFCLNLPWTIILFYRYFAINRKKGEAL